VAPRAQLEATRHHPRMLSPDGMWRWDGFAWVPTAMPVAHSYRPVGPRSRMAVVGLAIAGLAELVSLGALTGRLDIVNRISDGQGVVIADAVRSDDTVRAAAFLQLGATALCAVFFLLWLHRAVANNHALGGRALRFSPRAAVGWWFAPMLNLVVPFRILAETWRAADPARPHSTPDQRTGGRLSPVLAGWWLTLAFGSLLATIANVTHTSNSADLDSLRTATVLSMIAVGLFAVAAVLGATMVTKLTDRQRAQFAVVSGNVT
jgi:hypothetical protein